jgi:T-complex protein 1 subunit delta
MVIKDIDRDRINFVSKSLGATPVIHIYHFATEKLKSAGLAEEVIYGGEKKIVKITGCPNQGKIV